MSRHPSTRCPTDEPVVIVPLLLSAGYHVRVDLRKQSAGRDGVTIAAALGPDPRLVDVLVDRLGAARPRRRATPSCSRSRARATTARTTTAGRSGAMLGERLSREVTVGFLAAAEPRLGAAVAQAREPAGRVVVANYLLAPGYFHDLAVRLADGAPVARPLLDDDEPAASLVDIVVDRYRAARDGASLHRVQLDAIATV